MRKFFVLPLLFALGLALAACQEQTSQASGFKIGVVDMQRLMRESEPGKAGVKFLEEQQKVLQDKLDDIQDRLEKNSTDQALMNELQKVYAASQQQIQVDGQNVAGQIFDMITKIMDAWRDANGYDALFAAEAMASFKPSLDVTSSIMAEVNKQKIEFKPSPLPAAITAPPAENAPAQAGENQPMETKPATDSAPAASGQ